MKEKLLVFFLGCLKRIVFFDYVVLFFEINLFGFLSNIGVRLFFFCCFICFNMKYIGF